MPTASIPAVDVIVALVVDAADADVVSAAIDVVSVVVARVVTAADAVDVEDAALAVKVNVVEDEAAHVVVL